MGEATGTPDVDPEGGNAPLVLVAAKEDVKDKAGMPYDVVEVGAAAVVAVGAGGAAGCVPAKRVLKEGGATT